MGTICVSLRELWMHLSYGEPEKQAFPSLLGESHLQCGGGRPTQLVGSLPHLEQTGKQPWDFSALQISREKRPIVVALISLTITEVICLMPRRRCWKQTFQKLCILLAHKLSLLWYIQGTPSMLPSYYFFSLSTWLSPSTFSKSSPTLHHKATNLGGPLRFFTLLTACPAHIHTVEGSFFVLQK